MITTLIDFLVHFTISVIDFSGYTGVFILMFLESCGIPIPSEVIMPFSGFLVVEGRMSFWPLVLVGAFANLGGSLLAYWVGVRGGRPLIEKYGRYFLISRHDLDLADRWFSRYGELTVFFGRLLPVVRTYISFPAGVSKMNIKKFSLYTFLGALPWAALFTWLGIKLGSRWELIRQTLHNFDLAILLLIIVLVALYIWRHVKHSRRQG
ncbi:MAG: DedA family protein [Candidatus Buchananbacteria bacterium]|nr:DedA family protein [Candidatus Buchananbacteria bacterium]